MSGATPGQAAYEAWFGNDGADWNGRLNTFAQAAWENIAQRAIDAFLAGDSVSAETIREAIAAREPQPAPGPLALQLIIAVDALRAIADEPHPGFGPECAAKALDDIGTPGFGAPQPAPELAALRKAIAELAAGVQKSADATRPSKKTSVEDEIAIALRKLLEPGETTTEGKP